MCTVVRKSIGCPPAWAGLKRIASAARAAFVQSMTKAADDAQDADGAGRGEFNFEQHFAFELQPRARHRCMPVRV